MKTKTKYIITILTILIVTTLAVSLPFFSKKFECKMLENKINQMLETANHCTTSSDCSVNTESSCPFGCYNLVNKNTKLDEIITKMQTHNSECTQCVYGCTQPPTKTDIICKENKCIDTRYTEN